MKTKQEPAPFKYEYRGHEIQQHGNITKIFYPDGKTDIANGFKHARIKIDRRLK